MNLGRLFMCTGKRVMVVDDHVVVRQMLCSLFALQGFEVSDAEDGGQALQRAQEVRPDLIILDFAMPGMNGIEAARALKAVMPRVPLIMFTNTVGSILDHEASAAGISIVVSKSEPAAYLIAQAKMLLN
jgi:CheY-like chemotaxis protein